MLDKKVYNRAWSKANYQRNKQAILAKQKNSPLVKLTKRESAHLLKTRVLSHYSNPRGIPICNNCGEQDIDILCIDHINGGGWRHRRKLGLSGNMFYRWLKKNNYPKGYQTLCMNCQFIKETGRENQ